MKPAFALDLSHEGIGLYHRSARGWTHVGSVALDDPKFTDTLGFLRTTAVGLAPRGLSTKLVIPNSEVLYLSVHAPGPGEAERHDQIRTALEGRTPYAVADLVFDWSGTGPEVRVAVVTRETLEEAEAFAADHRFNPLCFVAAPEPGRFDGEPLFGLARGAAGLLAEGEAVDRDDLPLVIGARTAAEGETTAPPPPAAPVSQAPAATAAEAPAAAEGEAPAATEADAPVAAEAAAPRPALSAPGLPAPGGQAVALPPVVVADAAAADGGPAVAGSAGGVSADAPPPVPSAVAGDAAAAPAADGPESGLAGPATAPAAADGMTAGGARRGAAAGERAA
ncbi:MAG: hypothetical protein KJZ85_20685, partial [Rhodobacteraceae bacterium]|nr:hypothetical protein [Paracoccaceae bacterium]